MESENLTQSEIIKMLAIHEREKVKLSKDCQEKLEKKLPEIKKENVKHNINSIAPMVFWLAMLELVLTIKDSGTIPESLGIGISIAMVILFFISLVRFSNTSPYYGKDNLKEEHYDNFYSILTNKEFESLSILKDKVFLSESSFEHKREGVNHVAVKFKDIDNLKRKINSITEYIKIA